METAAQYILNNIQGYIVRFCTSREVETFNKSWGLYRVSRQSARAPQTTATSRADGAVYTRDHTDTDGPGAEGRERGHRTKLRAKAGASPLLQHVPSIKGLIFALWGLTEQFATLLDLRLRTKSTTVTSSLWKSEENSTNKDIHALISWFVVICDKNHSLKFG